MNTPIYDKLAEELGVFIPDPLEQNPLSTLLPVSDAAHPTMALPLVQRVAAGGPPTGDVGDWVDPNAYDPTPPEVVDRRHPDYVDPWRAA